MNLDNCSKERLEGELIKLVEDVEGVQLPFNYFEETSREELISLIDFYELLTYK